MYLLFRRSEWKSGLKLLMGWGTDCHTSDIGHWFAMTGYEKTYVIPRSEATWESVFFVGQGPRALPGVRRLTGGGLGAARPTHILEAGAQEPDRHSR